METRPALRGLQLLRSVDGILDDRYIGDGTWLQLADHLGRKQIMNLVFTVGAYDLLAVALDLFGLELDPDLEGFPPEAPG